ncbi:hypothetical protein QZH41_003847 [Actinostola sp. cb2023]|nr:hypothetical protein QZH41_003847 [Actinostola sp. cb2023]
MNSNIQGLIQVVIVFTSVYVDAYYNSVQRNHGISDLPGNVDQEVVFEKPCINDDYSTAKRNTFESPNDKRSNYVHLKLIHKTNSQQNSPVNKISDRQPTANNVPNIEKPVAIPVYVYHTKKVPDSNFILLNCLMKFYRIRGCPPDEAGKEEGGEGEKEGEDKKEGEGEEGGDGKKPTPKPSSPPPSGGGAEQKKPPQSPLEGGAEQKPPPPSKEGAENPPPPSKEGAEQNPPPPSKEGAEQNPPPPSKEGAEQNPPPPSEGGAGQNPPPSGETPQADAGGEGAQGAQPQQDRPVAASVPVNYPAVAPEPSYAREPLSISLPAPARPAQAPAPAAPAPVAAARLESPVAAARLEAPAVAARLEAPVAAARLEAPVAAARLEAPAVPARLEAPVDAARLEAPAVPARLEAPVVAARVLAGISPFLRGAGSFSLGLLAEKPETRKVILLMSLVAQIVTPLLCLIPHPANTPGSIYPGNGTTITNKTAVFPLQDPPAAAEDYLETIQGCIKGNCFGYMLTASDDEPYIPKRNFTAHGTNSTVAKSPLLDIDLDVISTFWIIVAIITVGEFLGGPARSLADAATLQALGKDMNKFGYIRLWGNVGQLLLTIIIYLLLRYEHKTINGVEEGNYLFAVIAVSFWMSLAFPTALGFVCDHKKDSNKILEKDDLENNSKVELVDVLINFTSLSLMVITFCIGMLNGTFNTFMFWFVLDIAGSQANLIITVALALRIAFIILAFRISGPVINLLGVMNVTHVSMVLYCGIFVLYGVMRNPWLAIIPEVLQNVIKAFTEVAVILYFGEISPFRWSAIVQGIIQSLLEGFGFGLGPIFGGFMVYSIGIRTTFFLFGAFAAGVGIFSMCNHGISWIMKGSARAEYHIGNNRD